MTDAGLIERTDSPLDSVVMTESQNPLSSEDRVREFEELALPYTKLLFGAALNKTKNYTDAEDLVQETFAKAFRSWHQFEKGTNLRAWLVKILENTYINMYNKKAKQIGQDSLSEMEDFQLGEATSLTARSNRSAELEALDRVASKDVREALQNLGEDFRMVVYYAVVEGLSYSEISEVMDTPMGTVMSRLHRGKKALHEALKDFAAEEGYDVTPTKEKKAAQKATRAPKADR
jgi:RNA polymerase sigma-70 factor (ECF subfamily)